MHTNMYACYLFLIYATNIVLILYGMKQEKNSYLRKIPENKNLSHLDILPEFFLTVFKNVDLKLFNVSSFNNYRD